MHRQPKRTRQRTPSPPQGIDRRRAASVEIPLFVAPGDVAMYPCGCAQGDAGVGRALPLVNRYRMKSRSGT